MPISTDNGKLAAMELDTDWEPGLPLSPGAIGLADQQQLLWGFPEILWGEEETEVEVVGGVFRRPGLISNRSPNSTVSVNAAAISCPKSANPSRQPGRFGRFPAQIPGMILVNAVLMPKWLTRG